MSSQKAKKANASAARTGRRGRIADAFADCKRRRRSAFIPFLFAGDPSLAKTGELLDALVAGGADVIELGVPFSDPIADGPVNQRAAGRSLEAGTTMAGIFDCVARWRERSEVPIVLFTYFNPVHARGLETFAEQAAASGVDGLLCVDLPPEEARKDLIPALRGQGIDPVFLLSPTSTAQRVRSVAASSSGFVYYVSRAGVTGERSHLPEQLIGDLRRLRRRVKLPLAVGFGISTPEQTGAVAAVADGVVVGSALVRLVEEGRDDPKLAERIQQRVEELAAPLTRPRFRLGLR